MLVGRLPTYAYISSFFLLLRLLLASFSSKGRLTISERLASNVSFASLSFLELSK